MGITTLNGGQFCELNSTGVNEMWQNVETVPGTRMRWAITYRYRSNSSESIRLKIGAIGSTVNITDISNNNGDEWITHSGFYIVPAGQTTTQFRIATLSPSGSSGNLIDDIDFYSIEPDIESPVLGGTLPSNQTENPNALCEFILPDYTSGVTATDNCDADLVISQSPVAGITISANTEITITATDDAGNSSEHKFNVELLDDEDPIAVCKPITILLDNLGSANIIASQVDNGSSDNCNIASMSISPNTFTCSDIGPNTVVLTVTDDSGNVSTCSAVVTVEGAPDVNLSVLGDTKCLGDDAVVTIQTSEVGVVYRAFRAGVQVGSSVTGNGGDVNITIPTVGFSIGNNVISFKAVKGSCEANMTNLATIAISQNPTAVGIYHE
jgi:hypothetical protein